MAINQNGVDEALVENAIASALEEFYHSLLEKIDAINVKDIMKRKNPYLYRAKAMQSAAEIVESVLSAAVSSSEETIFGNCFFEPLVIAASGGSKALAEGVDIMVEDRAENVIYAIAVKSGPPYLTRTAKSDRNRILTPPESWPVRPEPDMSQSSATATEKSAAPAGAVLPFIGSWPGRTSGRS